MNTHTKYSSTLYNTRMDEVLAHYACTFEIFSFSSIISVYHILPVSN